MENHEQKIMIKNNKDIKGESTNYLKYLLDTMENIENIIKSFQDQIYQMKKLFKEFKILLQQFNEKNSFENIKKELIQEIS